MTCKKSYFIYVLLALAILVGFNNCTPFVSDMNLASSGGGAYRSVCEAQLKAAFQRTYHPFLQTNCNACHSTAHGSRDLNVAYQAFMSRGEALIDYQSTHAHGGNSFTSSMQEEIDKFKASWTGAQNNYQECLEQGASNGSVGLKTIDKVMPNILRTADNNSWSSVEWDLEKELGGHSQFKAILKVEAKLNKFNGVISGLLIRNPTMRLKDGSPNILVSGMMVYINGVKQTSVTTYSGLSKIVSLKTPVPLVDSGAAYIVHDNLQEGTLLGIEFGEIKNTNSFPDEPDVPVVGPPVEVDIPDVPIPDGGVTFAQLTSSTSPYRVFNRSCVSCHGSNSSSLNLASYNVAKENATKIIERMNSTTAPMPPTGRLRQNDRDMVRSWVNSGMPER